MSGAEIVGLIMAIVGAATQMYASNQANKAAQARMNAGYMQLRDSQDKINQKIAQATENYQTNNRENTQAAEAERIANDIKTDVAESQQIRDAQQTTVGNVSNDYEAAKAAASQKTNEEMNAFADLLGKIRSAGTLRQKEGFNTARIGQDIQFLGRNAQGNMMVTQDEAQQALHSYDGLANFGKLVGAAGTVLSLGAGAASAGAGAAGSAAASTGSTAASTGAGAAGTAGVDAISGAAITPTLAQSAGTVGSLPAAKAGLWWSTLSPLAKSSIIAGGLSAGSAAATQPWRRS